MYNLNYTTQFANLRISNFNRSHRETDYRSFVAMELVFKYLLNTFKIQFGSKVKTLLNIKKLSGNDKSQNDFCINIKHIK